MSHGHIYADKVSLGDGVDRTVICPRGDGTLEQTFTKTYPPQGLDPLVPVPGSGDRYYNNIANEWRYFDGLMWVPYGTAPPPPTPTPSPVIMGAGSVGSSTTPRYLFPSYSEALAQTVAVPWRVTRAGAIQNLYIEHNDPQGNGGLIVYTVRVNGIVTPISVALASTAPTGMDLTNSILVGAGSQVDIQITKAASVGVSPRDVVATWELS